MAQTYSLDTVIRIADKDARPSSSAEKVVVIDTGKKKVVTPSWREYFSELKYFLVSNTKNSRKEAEGKVSGIKIKDFTKGQNLEIDVSYLVSCDPGREEQVALALFEAPTPKNALEDLIAGWVKEYAGMRPTEFIETYYDKKDELEKRLTARALSEVGLNLQANLSLGEEEKLKPVVVGPVHFPVRVKDYDEEQNLKFRVDLLPDEQNKIKAILHYPKNGELKAIIQEEFRRYFAANITLQQFCTALKQEPIRQALVGELNRALEFAGRRAGFLTMEGIAGGAWIYFFKDEQDIPCTIHEYPKQIVVNNKVQMILEDIARYKAAKSPELKGWLRKTLERVIQRQLFKAKYTTLLLDFEPHKKEIERLLEHEAQAIGYKIEQLTSIPNLEQLAWKEKFTIEATEEFETNISRAFVKLNIVVTSRFETFKRIEQYLNTQQDVMALIKEAVLNTAREFLHTISPERFYIHFNHPNEKRKEESKSVRWELVERLSTLLKGFGAKVIHLTPKVVETDVIERLKRLERELCEFEVRVVPLRIEEAVTFKGTFTLAVHGDAWHTFQTRDYEIDKIKQYVEEAILAQLEKRSIEDLRYIDDDLAKDIRREAEEEAQRSALEAFGLGLTISKFRRVLTAPEEKRQEELEKLRVHAIETFAQIRSQELDTLLNRSKDISKQLAQLSTRYGQAITEDTFDKEELEMWSDKMKLLQGQLSNLSQEIVAKQMAEEEQKLISSRRQIETRQDRPQLASGLAEEPNQTKTA